MNQGSAKQLLGNIYHLTCFISDEFTFLEYDEKSKIFEKIRESETWFIKQAKHYGAVLNFQGGTFGFEKDIKFSKIEKGNGIGNERVDWISRVLYMIGYKSTKEFYDWCKQKNYDNIFVLIFAKGKGRGYSMQYSNNMDVEKYYVEGAILYEQHHDGQMLFSSTIAHEILHLFGAWDLYETFQQNKKNAEKAEILYPNSIMRRVSQCINDLCVDEITAWRIGWKQDFK